MKLVSLELIRGKLIYNLTGPIVISIVDFDSNPVPAVWGLTKFPKDCRGNFEAEDTFKLVITRIRWKTDNESRCASSLVDRGWLQLLLL